MRRLALLLVTIAAPAEAQRYLSGPGLALVASLPPAPVTKSPQDAADRATFRETRSFERSPRWDLATLDVDERIPSMLANFAPVAGRTLSIEATPILAQLLGRVRRDVAAAVNAVKPIYARRRPFLADPGPVCQPRAALAKSFDYPSGHTSWGTAVSLILSELMPANASAILQRGRDYGDSRVICGAHNASAVEAGRIAAAAVVARLHGEPAFRADLDAARGELDHSSISPGLAKGE